MEKLIELLNKYQEGKGSEIRFKRIDNSDFFVCGDDVGLGYETILSKKFGFIKWLVENDKIDRESENYPLKKHSPYFNDDVLAIVSQDCNTYEDRCRVYYDNYESLLMLLSIQDNPIDFLVSILK